ARVQARDVVHRAARLRHDLELAAADRSADALVVGVEGVEQARGGDRDRSQGGRVVDQLHVDRAHLVQGEVDVVFGPRARARGADGDLVGTAHAQAARVVAAAGIGHGAAHRARLHVRDHDFGAGHRLPAAVGDDAADARRRALGEDGRRGERGDQADRQFRESKAVATGYVGSLDGWSWDTGWTGGTCGRWCAMGMRPRRATWPWVNIRLTRYRLQM